MMFFEKKKNIEVRIFSVNILYIYTFAHFDECVLFQLVLEVMCTLNNTTRYCSCMNSAD